MLFVASHGDMEERRLGYIVVKVELGFKYLDLCRDSNRQYIISQNYTIMVVGKHGIQTFKVVVVMLLLLLLSHDVFRPHKYTSLTIFGQVVCPNLLNVSYWNHVLDCSCLQDITTHHTTL